jgi:hypothetical protein
VSLATDQFNLAVSAMLTALDGFLPVSTPPSTVALVSAAERPVGVGNWAANVERGAAAVVGVRGGRVDARVRFDLRGATAEAAATSARDLQTAVRNALPTRPEFLVLEPVDGTPAELLSADEKWRQSVEYRALYEYRYEDPEESGSLIVRIPVELRGEQREDDLVTRDLTRWDREGAPPLVLHGPRRIGELSFLAFTGGGAPAGQVIVRRTFDRAPPPPPPAADLAAFAAALAAGSRNERLVLADVQALLALDARPPPRPEVLLARLGDLPAPPPGGVTAQFQAYSLAALRDARLEGPGDRFEIVHQFAGGFPGGSNAVVYLRAGRGSAA